MATILSGLLVEEVAKELLEEVSLLETLPVILIAVDVSAVVVELLSSLLFLAQEMKVRLKRDMRIMYKIFFIFYLNTKSKILLVRQTQNITSIGLFYKNRKFYLESV